MTHRYYLDTNLTAASEVWLDDQEAHHLLHVMRAKSGERVELFDGRGSAVSAIVVETQKRKARLQIDPATPPAKDSVTAFRIPQIILATAVPKGDRFRWLLEKATELGVSQIIPLTTSRSVVTPRDSKIEKHQQYIIDACKQSGRNQLLQLSTLMTLTEALASLPDSCLKFTGDPRANDFFPNRMSELTDQQIAIFIGPEGGFTQDEESLLDQNAIQRLCAGPYILRTETAGLAICSLFMGLLSKAQPASH